MLREVAARQGDREALVVGERRVTYAELERDSARIAGGLLELGVRRGDVVALFAPNLVEAYVAFYAVTRIGGVFAPLNPRLTARELAHAVERCRPQVLLTLAEEGGYDFTERLAHVRAEVPRLVALRGELDDALTWARLLEDGSGPGAAERLARAGDAVEPGDSAILQFTSGTTSQPKGALLSQGATCRMAVELGRRFGLGPGDRYFGCSPICHLGGMTFSMVAVIGQGATFVTLPTFSAGAALEAIAAEDCSVVHGIDTHLTLLTGHEAFDPSALPLRLVSVSALAETVERVAAAFGAGVVTISQYGSTETGGAPTCGAYDDPRDKLLSTVGRPLPGIDLAVVDPASQEEVVLGETGEIRVGGWSLMIGYLSQPEEFARSLDGRGRLRTGDLGHLDDDGYLHFTGRLKNMLRVGGENVSVEEVELVLKAHPDVRDAVVVGVADDRLGEVAYAYVVPGSARPPEEAGLLAHCRGQLATFKVPRRFELIEMDDVPLIGSGKIDRRALAARAAGRAAPALGEVSAGASGLRHPRPAGRGTVRGDRAPVVEGPHLHDAVALVAVEHVHTLVLVVVPDGEPGVGRALDQHRALVVLGHVEWCVGESTRVGARAVLAEVGRDLLATLHPVPLQGSVTGQADGPVAAVGREELHRLGRVLAAHAFVPPEHGLGVGARALCGHQMLPPVLGDASASLVTDRLSTLLLVLDH
nr:class I adenylate-forming enzyme family protein [Nocardioides humi]